MDSGIVEVNSPNALDGLMNFTKSLDGTISSRLDDFENNKDVVKQKREEYGKLRRECEKCFNNIADQFADWLGEATRVEKEQQARMMKCIGKGDTKEKSHATTTPTTAVAVHPPRTVWNNFVPAKIKMASGEIKDISKPVPPTQYDDKNVHSGMINGIELGPTRTVKSVKHIPNIVLFQLESDLENEQRSKFFYIRVNGQLIQGSIPKRQKQGSLRKYRSCYHVKPGAVTCKDKAEKCRFYHDPRIDSESTDVRNYPELSRYTPCSTYTEFGEDYSPNGYNDSIGDIDELENDLIHITEHEVYVFGQKTLGSLLCLMAATKRKPVALMADS